MRRTAWAGGLVLGMGLLLLAGQTAWAVIIRLVPLREVLTSSDYICLAKIEKLDPDKPSVVLTVAEDFKRKAPFRRLPINLTGDSEAKKDNHTPQLLKRLGPDLPLLVFVTERGKRYTAFCYTNGTWFQVLGEKTDDTLRWSFTHCEPYLRRTFKGTTAELRAIIVDGLAGKRKPPEPNEKEPPGFGPEFKAEEKKDKEDEQTAVVECALHTARHNIPGVLSTPYDIRITYATGPLFAVIPTVLAGPLALLALLFPAVFGGLMLSMRRWFVALSVVSLNSTLYLAHSWFQGSIHTSWWGSPLVLWGCMTLLTLLGTLWAWQRHRAAVRSGQTLAATGRLESWVLGSLTVVGLALVSWSLYQRESLLAPTQRSLLVVWIGVWAGTLTLLGRRGLSAPRLSGEGVMLAAMLCAYVGVGAAIWPRGPAVTGAVRIAWEFRPAEQGQLLSSPRVVGDRAYVAVAHSKGFTTYGILYCLNRVTGKELWRFDDDGALQQVFSSPCVADGRLYVGEGLHQDRACKLYCLDAANGTKLWEFATQSHTESSPCVAGGKVFCGAGDDGLYALDAVTGKLLWSYQREVHIDASPVVVGQRLYVGSGVSRKYRNPEVLCLNIESGQPVWRLPVDLPAWGEPLVVEDRLILGLGNGNLLQSDHARPTGAVLCLDATTGRRLWRHDLPDGVHVRPVVAEGLVVVGCRDGHLHALDLREGQPRWQHELGSPVVASPAQASGRLYAAGTAGRVACLQADTGAVVWTLDLAVHAQTTAQVIGSPLAIPEHRQLLVGTSLGGDLALLPVLYCLED